jgi:hypothetical protein
MPRSAGRACSADTRALAKACGTTPTIPGRSRGSATSSSRARSAAWVRATPAQPSPPPPGNPRPGGDRAHSGPHDQPSRMPGTPARPRGAGTSYARRGPVRTATPSSAYPIPDAHPSTGTHVFPQGRDTPPARAPCGRCAAEPRSRDIRSHVAACCRSPSTCDRRPGTATRCVCSRSSPPDRATRHSAGRPSPGSRPASSFRASSRSRQGGRAPGAPAPATLPLPPGRTKARHRCRAFVCQ